MLLGNKVSGSVAEPVHSDPSLLLLLQPHPHPAPQPPKPFQQGTLRSPVWESDMSCDICLSHPKILLVTPSTNSLTAASELPGDSTASHR